HRRQLLRVCPARRRRLPDEAHHPRLARREGGDDPAQLPQGRELRRQAAPGRARHRAEQRRFPRAGIRPGNAGDCRRQGADGGRVSAAPRRGRLAADPGRSDQVVHPDRRGRSGLKPGRNSIKENHAPNWYSERCCPGTPPSDRVPGPAAPIEGFHYTGPWTDPHARPLAYASMGTLQNGVLQTFRRIAEACAGLDLQLVISLGGGQDPVMLRHLPGDPIVVGYAPQLELIRRAALTISHGGLNTVLESLQRGVPMVVLPVTNDQPGVGTRVERTGVGRSIPVGRLTVARLRDAVHDVLSEPAYRARAALLRQSIRAADGLNRAADIVDETFGARPPAFSPVREQRRSAGGGTETRSIAVRGPASRPRPHPPRSQAVRTGLRGGDVHPEQPAAANKISRPRPRGANGSRPRQRSPRRDRSPRRQPIGSSRWTWR